MIFISILYILLYRDITIPPLEDCNEELINEKNIKRFKNSKRSLSKTNKIRNHITKKEITNKVLDNINNNKTVDKFFHLYPVIDNYNNIYQKAKTYQGILIPKIKTKRPCTSTSKTVSFKY